MWQKSSPIIRGTSMMVTVSMAMPYCASPLTLALCPQNHLEPQTFGKHLNVEIGISHVEKWFAQPNTTLIALTMRYRPLSENFFLR